MKLIKVDRQSVYMSDDVAVPNEGVIAVADQDTIREVIKKVAEYLPRMAEAVWAVDTLQLFSFSM